MDTTSYKTKSLKPDEVEHDWHIVDAAGKVVGRLASQVARILRGKHKPTYTPHVDTGDFVIVVNAEKARFTGRKETDKNYFEYSGYPGGDKGYSPEYMREKRPAHLIEHAVEGMLPNGPLGSEMFKKLKVYAGPDHPHQAQQPKPLEIDA